MRRMDGVSAFLYHQEKSGAIMHTLKISVLDTSEIPGGWDYALFRRSIAGRLHLLPMFRWKALNIPFGLHHPVWVDDPNFDLDYHVRRIACPAPGDRKAFCELVSQVYAWPLDLSKPLWLCWVVEGLENNEVALVILLHHAYTDGSGAARLLNKIYSAGRETPELEAVGDWVPEKTPGRLELLGRALIDLPRTWIHNYPHLRKGIKNARALKEKYRQSGRELPPSAFRDTRDSPFNIMLGRGRTFVYETLPLDDIRAISKGFGVTINDLFVAASAGAYRKFMQTRGFDPDTGPLVAAIPVAKRPPLEEDDMIGNMTSADYLAMPVHIADPAARLKASAHAGDVMKEHLAAEGMDLSSILEVTPPAAIRLLDWIVKRKDGKFGIWGNAAISNVPGPREPLYMGALRLNNWISMGMVAHGLGINTTVWSYADKFNLCILADKNLLPDGWELIGYFRTAFDEYLQLLEQQVRDAAGSEEKNRKPALSNDL